MLEFAVKILRLKVYMKIARPMTLTLIQVQLQVQLPKGLTDTNDSELLSI